MYLHYDPYTVAELGGRPALARQRMDFLMLMPDRARIVVEVDGKHHYAEIDGAASPRAYSAMVAEDRELRRRRYEVYRFGGHELGRDDAVEMLSDFFDRLLQQHSMG